MDTERLLLELVEESGEAIVVADRDGTIQFWNRGATDVFGYEPKSAEGESLDIIIPEKLQERHWEAYDRAMETGEFSYDRGELLSVPAVDQAGDRLSVEFTVTPLVEGDTVVAIGAVIRDVTDQWEERQERKARIEELEERVESLQDGE
ncbi:MAG: PAS domain S-box protein [Halanaeroarchaeum sp.]